MKTVDEAAIRAQVGLIPGILVESGNWARIDISAGASGGIAGAAFTANHDITVLPGIKLSFRLTQSVGIREDGQSLRGSSVPRLAISVNRGISTNVSKEAPRGGSGGNGRPVGVSAPSGGGSGADRGRSPDLTSKAALSCFDDYQFYGVPVQNIQTGWSEDSTV